MPNEPNARSPLAWVLAIAVPVVAVGGVVFGVIVLGRLAHEQQSDRDRIEFKDIECTSPPEMSTEKFLGEVQYLAALPDRLDPADDLVKKLLAAFLRHPWVAEVTAIKLLPEHRVRVQLRFRTAVLAVTKNGKKWAVDEKGFRLPDAAPTTSLPVLRLVEPPPVKVPREGTVWNDERVTAAAKTVAFIQEGTTEPVVSEIEGSADKLVLTTPSGAKITWGHAPGSEVAGEESATEKRDRLLKR